MTDVELLTLFESGVAPPGGFRHADHVRVAWSYLRAEGLVAAAARFTANLKRFAEAQGKPSLYHETITLAYLLLIHDRMARGEPAEIWDEFAAANPDLLAWKPSILDRYYSAALLDSALARQTFVWPDRMPV